LEHFELLATAGNLKLTKQNGGLFELFGGGGGGGASSTATPAALVDSKGKPVPAYEASGYEYEPRGASDAWLDAEDLMARCAFSAEIYTRGCHWIPRMFA
jgi:hypothetical protein